MYYRNVLPITALERQEIQQVQRFRGSPAADDYSPPLGTISHVCRSMAAFRATVSRDKRSRRDKL